MLYEDENPYNVIEPGKRPRATLTPAMAIKNGEPFVSFAVQGGDTQDQNLAEEPGLLGSTEWVEHNKDEIREKMIVYINTDGTGVGFLGVGGSHSLEKFVNEISDEVLDPVQNIIKFISKFF